MSRYPKQRIKENQSEYNQTILSNRVVELVNSGYAFSEVECEPLVKKWIRSIPASHRPELHGVLMDSKRALNGMTPIS